MIDLSTMHGPPREEKKKAPAEVPSRAGATVTPPLEWRNNVCVTYPKIDRLATMGQFRTAVSNARARPVPALALISAYHLG